MCKIDLAPAPTEVPTATPLSATPTAVPIASPSDIPSAIPTESPSTVPTAYPTQRIDIPAKIESEDYDYMEGVAIGGGGSYVGWTDPGDFMDYTIVVPSSGLYSIAYRVASGAGGSDGFNLLLDSTVIDVQDVPATAGAGPRDFPAAAGAGPRDFPTAAGTGPRRTQPRAVRARGRSSRSRR